MRNRKKRLTRAELRALGATPGLILHRVDREGRARLEELVPEAKPPKNFAHKAYSANRQREEGDG